MRMSDQLRDIIKYHNKDLETIAKGARVRLKVLQDFVHDVGSLNAEAVDRLCSYLELELVKKDV